MFKKLISRTVAAILAAASLSTWASTGSPAQGVTPELDFTGRICATANGKCVDGSFLSQSYGDIPDMLDVSHRGVNAAGDELAGALQYWTSGYSGVGEAIWTGSSATSSIAEMRFTPSAGYQVSLLDLHFGNYVNRSTIGSSFVVLDAATQDVLFSSGNFLPAVNQSANFSLPASVSSTSGLILRWGPDAWDVGLGYVRMSVTPVPEPETWAMLLAGLCVMAGVARRRTQRS